MAKQGKGLNSITIALFAFVGLWLATTVFLVILYTHQEEIRNRIAEVTKRNSQLISGSEQSNEFIKGMGVGDQTAVGLLESARSESAQLATGDAKDDPARIKTKRDEILKTIQRDGIVTKPDSFLDLSMHEALTRLYEEYTREHGVRVEGDKRVATLETQVKDLIATNDKERADFETRTKGLADEMKSVEGARAAHGKKRDQDVSNLEGTFKQLREQTDTELTKERQARATAERNNQELQKRLAATQEKYAELEIGPEELSTVRKADGHILKAVPGDDVVFIDLGENDRLILGMQFAVYPAEGVIPVDGRAKAQIEIVAIYESAAECKIVRVAPTQIILDGDMVVNPIYDPARALTFAVVGDFDLNRDGLVDFGGAGVIESLITNWGGTVTPDLTALTDFVVVGQSPRRASSGGESKADADAQTKRLADRYTEITTTANNLSIPILTQDVFLGFLGYSDRMAAR